MAIKTLNSDIISFNKPYTSADEINNIVKAVKQDKICGDGFYTKLFVMETKKELIKARNAK